MENKTLTAKENTMEAKRWMVKCSECRCTISFTDNIQESNEGGTCKKCWVEMLAIANGAAL